MLTFLTSAIEFGVIFLFGCVGEILTEKSGHLNLGIPGIMCMGAAGGCLGVKLCYLASPAPSAFLVVLMGILFAMLFAAALGAIYGFLTVSLRSNQNVTGLACTIFGVGFTSFFLNNAVLTEGVSAHLSQAGLNFFNAPLPGADSLGWFGTLFLDHGILVYLAIVIAVIAAVVLRYTKAGLSLRAVGESPATADAVGINVTGYKYTAILLGAAIAGLGGLCYVMDYMGGIVGSTVDQTIQGIGWLCIALVIFAMWKPAFAILGSIVFGALYILYPYLNSILMIIDPDFNLPTMTIPLFDIIPYAVTILVLIATSIVGRRETQPPASLGLSYFREDR